MSRTRRAILDAIEAERERQDRVWGDREHPAALSSAWLAALLGIVSAATSAVARADGELLVGSLIKLGALVVVWIETYDRDRSVS